MADLSLSFVNVGGFDGAHCRERQHENSGALGWTKRGMGSFMQSNTDSGHLNQMICEET